MLEFTSPVWSKVEGLRLEIGNWKLKRQEDSMYLSQSKKREKKKKKKEKRKRRNNKSGRLVVGEKKIDEWSKYR
ncbi:hypothetical protein EYC80_004267 [Monilinia laxa]|uniref:Uncharacterized protein n=1 Tax=Monilinia laxa TaxID=61186 RepID=A0A5N6KM84_MONLA|nr:hypothetical protein EYC80_004267 [Monilinia laxa]